MFSVLLTVFIHLLSAVAGIAAVAATTHAPAVAHASCAPGASAHCSTHVGHPAVMTGNYHCANKRMSASAFLNKRLHAADDIALKRGSKSWTSNPLHAAHPVCRCILAHLLMSTSC